ncbi:MAG: response regulator transcription factor [Taibaiella sp.]|nr:response regulator transcription factor [Taibaiella sp.]
MNVVIIEDEIPARERLTELLGAILPGVQIIACHDTVQAAWKWFSHNTMPDLVMMDVHLADGTAFDLMRLVRIDCPIIFTTAYNKYAVEAFKENSIDYLLKPLKKADLEGALSKLSTFKNIFRPNKDALSEPQIVTYKKRFVVRYGENLKTISVDDIAYFSSESRATYAITYDGKKYPMDNTLDALEKIISPADFFRINRKYIISLKSIASMKIYSKARVLVKLDPSVEDQPVVSYERAADFKLWLSGEL